MKPKLIHILAILVLMLTLTSTVAAQDGGLEPQPGSISIDSTFQGSFDKDRAPQAMATMRSFTPSELEPVSIIVTLDAPIDTRALASAANGQVIHRYSKIFNGISMVLPADNVEKIATSYGVSQVYYDQVLQVDTDASPQFINAPDLWNELGGVESAGEGVVVGVLDTGIWPEHPHFRIRILPGTLTSQRQAAHIRVSSATPPGTLMTRPLPVITN